MFLRPTFISDPVINMEIEKLVKKRAKEESILPDAVLALLKTRPAYDVVEAVGDLNVSVPEENAQPADIPATVEPMTQVLAEDVTVSTEEIEPDIGLGSDDDDVDY